MKAKSLIALTVAVLCGSVSIASAQSARHSLGQPEPIQLSVASQPIAAALNDFARQSGLHVVIGSEIAAGVKSSAVEGMFTPETALQKLLMDTGLRYEYLDAQTVAVLGKKKSKAAPDVSSTGALRSGDAEYLRVAQAEASASSLDAGKNSDSRASTTADHATGTIQEIIVTAQKHEERLREVPISISAVTGAQMERQGASRFSDYAGYIPGLSYATSGIPGEGKLNLRGVATFNSPIASTAMYIDDIPTTTHGTWGASGYRPLDLFPYDLERVEVLRGPQGTLYGDSTIGGLVKYVTRGADVNAFSGAVGAEGIAVSGGDGLGGSVRGVINAPLAPGVLGVRISSFYQQSPGFVTNVMTGDKGINESEQRGLRVALRLVPSDAMSVDAQWLHSEFEADGRVYTSLAPGTRRPLYGDYEYAAPLQEPASQKFDLVSATVRYDFGRVNLTSVTGYSRAFRDFDGDQSALVRNWVRLVTGGVVTDAYGRLMAPTTTEKFTQEVRLASALDQQFTWIIGGYYSSEDTDSSQRIVPYRADDTIFTDVLELSKEEVKARYTDLSAFANATFKITDQWEVSGGIRHSRTTDDFHDRLTGTFLSGSPTEPYFDDIETDYKATTWSLSARYIASDDLMMFARAASGFRAGGVNYTWPGAQKSYDPDRLISYETGIRADFLDDRASMDLTVYYLDWKDLFIAASTPDGSRYLTNGGRADGFGAEFTATLRPTRNLVLTATAAYYGLKIREDLPTLGAEAGDRTPTSPAWSGSLLADYSVPLAGDWNLSLGGGVRWVTDTYSRFIHDPGAVQLRGYTVADLNAAIANDRWTLRGYVRNLTNDATILADSPPNRVVQMTPRTVGLALDLRF